MGQRKNLSNQKRHSFDFELAKRVFSDPLALIEQDPGSHGEDRWRIIGKVNDSLIAMVIFVVRDELAEVYRIISARQVTAHERKKYQEK
jgi:uncharacterized DUF497 family protein